MIPYLPAQYATTGYHHYNDKSDSERDGETIKTRKGVLAMFSFLLGATTDVRGEPAETAETLVSDGSTDYPLAEKSGGCNLDLISNAGKSCSEVPSTMNCCDLETCGHKDVQRSFTSCKTCIDLPSRDRQESTNAAIRIPDQIKSTLSIASTDCAEFNPTKVCRTPSARAQQLPIIFEFEWMKSAPRGSRKQRVSFQNLNYLSPFLAPCYFELSVALAGAFLLCAFPKRCYTVIFVVFVFFVLVCC